MAKFKVSLNIGLANAYQEGEIEIDDDELKGLEGDELEEYIHQQWVEWAWEYIDGGIRPVED